MPADLYMKVQDADGESKDKDHADWILIESVSLGIDMPVPNSPAQSGQRASGTANFGEITVTKTMDKSSPNLFKACCNGRPYTEDIEIDFVQPMGTSRLVYLKLRLSESIISSYDLMSASEGTAQETIRINYAKIIEEYTPQEKDQPGGVLPAGWDLQKNQEC